MLEPGVAGVLTMLLMLCGVKCVELGDSTVPGYCGTAKTGLGWAVGGLLSFTRFARCCGDQLNSSRVGADVGEVSSVRVGEPFALPIGGR